MVNLHPYSMELYPKLGPLNVKQFTNCRFGMMAWALLPVVFACYQYERDGFLADSVLVRPITGGPCSPRHHVQF